MATRLAILSLLFSLSQPIAALQSDTQSFSPAQAVQEQHFLEPTQAELRRDAVLHNPLQRRQSACAASYTACSSVGFPDVCCQPGTHCTTDFAQSAACCPNNAVCTGSIAGGGNGSPTSVAAQTSAVSPAGGGGSGVTSTATVTVLYSVPSGAETVAGGGGTGGGAGGALPGATSTGTVVGAPFPFTYIPHTFANAAQCSSYAAECAGQFSSCTSSLGAAGTGGVAVTITGIGITTANGAGGGGDAAGICSSLSTEACYGLQASQCPQYGTAAANRAAGQGRDSMLEELVRAGAGAVLGLIGGGLL